MLDRRILAVPAAAALAATLSAGGAIGATPKTQTLHLAAARGGAIKFSTTKLVAKHPGKIKLVMKNPSSAGLSHGIALARHGTGRTVAPGRTSTVTATLKKGRYTFYCPVPGHRSLGMKGTLVVK
jgi:plastocyanin